MDLFHVVDDAFVILRQRGVYKQVKAYRRGGDAFAQIGSGFVRLLPRGGTTVPAISWLEIDAPGFDERRAKWES